MTASPTDIKQSINREEASGMGRMLDIIGDIQRLPRRLSTEAKRIVRIYSKIDSQTRVKS